MFVKRHAIILSVMAIFLAIVTVWIIQIVNGIVPYTDQWTRVLVDTYSDTGVYTFFRAITDFGSKSFVQPFAVVMVFILLILFRDWLPAVIFGIGTLGSHKLNELIKVLVARERPSISVAANAEGYSFPSGHSMVTMVCYGLLAYFIVKKFKSTKVIFTIQFAFALLIFLIGISRFFINVHYLTDILAGFFLGFICLIGFIYLYEYIQRRRTRSRG